MELYESRMNICKQCPLYLETPNGPRCNNKKFIHPDGRTSWLPKEGFIRGCNCLLVQKCANPKNHCVCGKW